MKPVISSKPLFIVVRGVDVVVIKLGVIFVIRNWRDLGIILSLSLEVSLLAKVLFIFVLETDQGTLLNRLFGTNFDVMDETQRKQTTKGIYSLLDGT
jgi:Root hair defective 3 GTP-binding protein (RHD3)